MKNIVKIVKVIYRNTVDGHIEVLRFENALTKEQIESKFGKEVCRIYSSSGDLFYGDDTLCSYVYCNNRYNLEIGVISKTKFQETIAYMKKCGKRLGEIRKQVAQEEFTKEHVITI